MLDPGTSRRPALAGSLEAGGGCMASARAGMARPVPAVLVIPQRDEEAEDDGHVGGDGGHTGGVVQDQARDHGSRSTRQGVALAVTRR